MDVGKGEADGQMGGGWADGRTAQRMEADGHTSGQADESGQGRLAVGRTGGQAGSLKGPTPCSPLYSRAPRLLASLESEFARHLGMHWDPSRGYVILFFAPNSIFAIQAQHYCEVCARIVLALSRIVTQNLWRERTIPWFRRY